MSDLSESETALGTRFHLSSFSLPTVIGFVAVLVFEGFLVISYAALPNVKITNPMILMYPFVWIDISLIAVLTTQIPQATQRRRYLGLFVAGGYFLVLAYFGGVVGSGGNQLLVQVNWSLPPGYAPLVLYDGPLIHLVVEPYKIIGYLSLTYLVYVTVLDAAKSAVSGVLGLFSCVSCAFPILATIATSLFGSTSIIATVALSNSYLFGTIIFVSAVSLLWWRPTFRS